jgi:hypothetical protein
MPTFLPEASVKNNKSHAASCLPDIKKDLVSSTTIVFCLSGAKYVYNHVAPKTSCKEVSHAEANKCFTN